MANYLRGSLKVLVSYCISLIIFAVFILTLYKYLWVYSFVIFLLMAALVYSDLNRLAVKEKRPQYDMNPYPFKGLVLGLIGFSPFIIIEAIYPFIVFQSEVAGRIKHLALNSLFGPLYWFIKTGNESVTAYALAALVVPVIAMLGYLSGFYGFEPAAFFKRFSKKPEPQKASNVKKTYKR